MAIYAHTPLNGRNDSFFLPADYEDLMTTIYAYYCKNGYPDELQDYIDNTAEFITEHKSLNYISDFLMAVAGAVDMWAFWEGFRACMDLSSGNTFRQIFEFLDAQKAKEEAENEEK